MRTLASYLAGSLVLSSSLLGLVGCGDNGGGSISDSVTMPGTGTNPTASAGTTDGSATDASASATDTPTGGMGTQTTGGSISGTETNATTGTGPNTATESSATDATGETNMTVPGTGTDPGTDTGDTSTGGVIDTTTDGTTSGSSTTTGADETTEDVPCQVQMATLKPVIPNMMLVLDKSGSMLTLWDHDANANTPTITRWNSLYQVVDTVVNKFNDKVNFGANLFPNKSAQQVYNANACLVNANVEIKVKAKNAAAILAGIPAANTMAIFGGTPAAAGMTSALNHLKTLPADVPRAILLVTDGAANCGMGLQPPPLFEQYDQNVHTIVGDAYTKDNIPTYVIGINTINSMSGNAQDGSPDNINAFTKLNELAVLGGNPKNDPNEKFYNADNQIELGAALDAVIADALSCIIPLDVEPAKPEFTQVKINGVKVPHVNSCAENGWVYTNPNGPYDAIELCGTACGNLKMTGKADVNFFCVPN